MTWFLGAVIASIVLGAVPNDVPPPPDVVQPSPKVVQDVSRPAAGSRHSATGVASWYCGHGSACTKGYAGGLYAAAGPALRVGRWRGRLVTVRAVDGSGASVRVRLVDCNCGPHANAIDLYADAFSRLKPLSAGVLRVSVSW